MRSTKKMQDSHQLSDPVHSLTAVANNIDQRRHVRVQLVTRAWLNLVEDAWLECTIHNLSGGGAMVELNEPPATLSPGQMLKISFRIGARYTIQAQVVWFERARTSSKMGLLWTDIDDEERNKLVLELLRVTVHRRRKSSFTK